MGKIRPCLKVYKMKMNLNLVTNYYYLYIDMERNNIVEEINAHMDQIGDQGTIILLLCKL